MGQIREGRNNEIFWDFSTLLCHVWVLLVHVSAREHSHQLMGRDLHINLSSVNGADQGRTKGVAGSKASPHAHHPLLLHWLSNKGTWNLARAVLVDGSITPYCSASLTGYQTTGSGKEVQLLYPILCNLKKGWFTHVATRS